MFETGHSGEGELERSTEKRETISELIDRADDRTVRSFLEEILTRDENLALQFETMVNPTTRDQDADKYKKVLDKVLSRYRNRYDFLDWQEADSYCGEISAFLSEHVGSLMDNQAYRTAFELSGYAFLQAAETDMDDSSGCLGELAENISAIWEEIYEACNDKTKEYMFNWCEKHLDGSCIDYMEEYIDSFYRHCFDEEIFLKKKLAFIDKKLSEYESIKKETAFNFKLSHMVKYRIQLMKELKYGGDAIEAFADRYWELSAIRQWLAQEREKQGNIDAAIQIYEQSLKMDCNLPGLMRDYALKLKDFYKSCNRDDDYCSMLWDLELKYMPGNPDIYRELKSYYAPKDWPVQRERVYKELPKYANLAGLLYEEGLYDRLLTCCLSMPGISRLRDYKTVLMQEYPGEILNRYVSTVEGMAQRTGTRTHYRELISLLREIQQMPGGKEEVNKITNKWRETYRNRPAMMDELKKL